MNGTALKAAQLVSLVSADAQLAAVGFNGDGRDDLLLRAPDGTITVLP